MRDDCDILTTCALRFDGWAYSEASGWDHRAALDRLVEHGEFPSEDSQILALFFLLQRALGKWDLVYEAPDSRCYWALRELFLRAWNLPIPEAFRNQTYCDEWDTNYGRNLADTIAVVRRVHHSIRYASTAKINPNLSPKHPE